MSEQRSRLCRRLSPQVKLMIHTSYSGDAWLFHVRCSRHELAMWKGFHGAFQRVGLASPRPAPLSLPSNLIHDHQRSNYNFGSATAADLEK